MLKHAPKVPAMRLAGKPAKFAAGKNSGLGATSENPSPEGRANVAGRSFS
jgi:hypothetical protein